MNPENAIGSKLKRTICKMAQWQTPPILWFLGRGTGQAKKVSAFIEHFCLVIQPSPPPTAGVRMESGTLIRKKWIGGCQSWPFNRITTTFIYHRRAGNLNNKNLLMALFSHVICDRRRLYFVLVLV